MEITKNNQAGAENTNTLRHIGEVVSDILNSNSPLAEGYRNYQMQGNLDDAVAKAAEDVAKKPMSFIRVESFANYVKYGLQMEQPTELVKHILVEHETTILFGDTGLGKSTMAMQMAIDVASTGRKVLFVNFELSQQQLAKKFPEKQIPDTLFIANIDYTLMHDVTDQSCILSEIEMLALQHGTEVIIIDNLTNLCINSKEGGEAGNVMLRLISLRMSHNWSMLILAHVPKRKPSDPLSLNDLAGSKILSNLADNVIGLNKSKLGGDKRYIIQLKYRSFPIELDYANVQELTLRMSDGYLHFEYGEFDEERIHLPRSRDEKAELERDIIKELKQPNGLSYRDIADKLGTSLSTVARTAREHGLSRGGKNDNKKPAKK